MKASHTTAAIVLQKRRYSETSLIVTWLTPQFGKIKTMAKGALRPKSSLSIDLFYLHEIHFMASPQSEIHRLIESQLQHPFLLLRRNWLTLQTVHYFTALTDILTPYGEGHEDHFHLLLKAFYHLESKPVTLRLLERFENRLLEYCGYASSQNLFSLPDIFHQHHLPLPPERQKLFHILST